MKQFTIIEEKWARGEKNGEPGLLNKDGAKCCLGFFCSALGVPDASLLDQGLPSGLGIPSDVCELLLEDASIDTELQTDLEETIADINDDALITDEYRKSQLAPLFAKLGYEIQYV